MASHPYLVLAPHGLGDLLAALRSRGHSLIGPRLDQGAIVYDAIESADDLPVGWIDEQRPGSYRLRQRDDGVYFAYVVGPHSWKRFLHPPRVTLFRLERSGDGFTTQVPSPQRPRYAFIGVRPCEIAAIATQDRIFLDGPFVDAGYAARRDDLFVVAVDCARAAETCFCASMDTGPRARHGFDLALTEVVGDDHHFVVEVGSAAGWEVMAEVPHREASEAEVAVALGISAATATAMVRHLDTDGIKERLYGSLDHPQWDAVAARCLACTNCTMVCPTCFCTSVHEVSDLDGQGAERARVWDSCFNTDFSYIHGGAIRASVKARYRQWLTHKLATWIDQFGTSGCVGCGRCITWCPVGIDLTAEVAALRRAATVPVHEES
ncbi:MAG TPA: 4Fe-4S dicluster domain-containing protein [bacterium]